MSSSDSNKEHFLPGADAPVANSDSNPEKYALEPAFIDHMRCVLLRLVRDEKESPFDVIYSREQLREVLGAMREKLPEELRPTFDQYASEVVRHSHGVLPRKSSYQKKKMSPVRARMAMDGPFRKLVAMARDLGGKFLFRHACRADYRN